MFEFKGQQISKTKHQVIEKVLQALKDSGIEPVDHNKDNNIYSIQIEFSKEQNSFYIGHCDGCIIIQAKTICFHKVGDERDENYSYGLRKFLNDEAGLDDLNWITAYLKRTK